MHDDETRVDDKHEQHEAGGRVGDGGIVEEGAEEAEDGGEREGRGDEDKVRDEEVPGTVCTRTKSLF